jgi:hypothetical protein
MNNDEDKPPVDPLNLQDERRAGASTPASSAALVDFMPSNTIPDKAGIVLRICAALAAGDDSEAREIARREYPFEARAKAGRQYTPYEMMQVFLRDGFVDRYTGQRLVFPGALRILSATLPEEFPAHPNWKMDESHMVYWELFPTIDHVVPVARGGVDLEPNWVTTSMPTNASKSCWTLEELGWSLRPPGDLAAWDGLTRWAIGFAAARPAQLDNDAYVKRWHNAAVRALREIPRDETHRMSNTPPQI